MKRTHQSESKLRIFSKFSKQIMKSSSNYLEKSLEHFVSKPHFNVLESEKVTKVENFDKNVLLALLLFCRVQNRGFCNFHENALFLLLYLKIFKIT
jgi:hypothetical protein